MQGTYQALHWITKEVTGEAVFQLHVATLYATRSVPLKGQTRDKLMGTKHNPWQT